MIDHIRGKICHKEPNLVVIECGGVGYACRTSLQTAAAVGGVDEDAMLYTRLAVREDEMALYGFFSRGERSCYDQLTGVSGIGPKAALAILSDFTPDRFALAVASGDYKQFTHTKGIGAKTAQRIVLELKDKVSKSVQAEGLPAVPAAAGSGSTDEALSALQVLGYSQGEAAGVLASLDPSLPSSELIRLALLQLGKNMFG
ncbi:MAG: Holliday junction branch migration protein RuvA [Oscillospiraceae bacterium]|nr:Holliday junction branch migration protein RuvA [Oscillospiraceae bacterium]